MNSTAELARQTSGPQHGKPAEHDSKPPFGQLNSTQINIVTTIDLSRALQTWSLADSAFLMDNSPASTGKGTPNLETVCRQGQVLNWLLYFVDMKQRSDGTWPQFAQIVNIVFLNPGSAGVDPGKVCTEFKIFGGPDAVRSKLVPSYYYWAGAVLPDLPPGRYPYRLIVQCNPPLAQGNSLLQLDGPALRVIPVDAPSAGA